MFNNANNLISPTQLILNQMEQSEFYFHLTGSRFFGTNNYDSDYDFFAQQDKCLDIFLENLGFEQQINPKYRDCSICTVWQLHDIHVQLVKNASQKERLQQKLKELNIFRWAGSSKEGRKRIWDFGFAIMNQNKPQGTFCHMEPSANSCGKCPTRKCET